MGATTLSHETCLALARSDRAVFANAEHFKACAALARAEPALRRSTLPVHAALSVQRGH